MSTESPAAPPAGHDDPALAGADAAAVLKHLGSGQPLDPAIVGRVRARAERVTADIRRDRGLVDDDTFQLLLDDEA
jgi:hypothetical protein